MADLRSTVGSVRLRNGWRHYCYYMEGLGSNSESIGGIETEGTAFEGAAVENTVVEVVVHFGGLEVWEVGVCSGRRMGAVGLRMWYRGLTVAVKAVSGGFAVLGSVLPM